MKQSHVEANLYSAKAVYVCTANCRLPFDLLQRVSSGFMEFLSTNEPALFSAVSERYAHLPVAFRTPRLVPVHRITGWKLEYPSVRIGEIMELRVNVLSESLLHPLKRYLKELTVDSFRLVELVSWNNVFPLTYPLVLAEDELFGIHFISPYVPPVMQFPHLEVLVSHLCELVDDWFGISYDGVAGATLLGGVGSIVGTGLKGWKGKLTVSVSDRFICDLLRLGAYMNVGQFREIGHGQYNLRLLNRDGAPAVRKELRA